MKKILSYVGWLAWAGLLLGCEQRQQTAPAQTEATPQTETTPQRPSVASPVAAYRQFLAQLDSSRLENVTAAADKFKELFQGPPATVADSGYVLFDGFYEELTNKVNELHYEDETDYSPLVLELKEPIPKKLKDFNDRLIANGFQVARTEGYTYFKQDRDFVAKHFYSFISPTLKEFLVQVNKENKEGFTEDAGLTIAPTQLAGRVLWWESFIKKNPGFILLKAAEAERKGYLYTLFEGMDNSPVLSYDTYRLDPYYKEAYQYLQIKAPNSEANQLIKPYFVALQSQDTSKANNLLTRYKLEGLVGY